VLVLSRKAGEKIMIGDGIEVVVKQIKGNRVTLAVGAPGGVRIVRHELIGKVNVAPTMAEKAAREAK
jgi:carbon storage regulator